MLFKCCGEDHHRFVSEPVKNKLVENMSIIMLIYCY